MVLKFRRVRKEGAHNSVSIHMGRQGFTKPCLGQVTMTDDDWRSLCEMMQGHESVEVVDETGTRAAEGVR